MFTKECDLPVGQFDVSTFSCSVIEGTTANPPSHIIHVGQPAWLRFAWTQTGMLPLYNLLNPACFWEAKVFFEKMGPGDGPAMPPIPPIPVVQGAASINYNPAPVALPALTAGVYKIVMTLNFYGPGYLYSLFHSFEEIGMIEVVSP